MWTPQSKKLDINKAQQTTHTILKKEVTIMKRIAVFLDGANTYYTQRDMGWYIDAEKLLNYCKEYGEIVEAVYYTGENNDPKQRGFLNKLAYIGYSLETKPVKTIRDFETGASIQKANLDIEIVLDMFNMIDRYDMAILVSGDGDFERAVRQLKSRGKEVKVISTRGKVATELVHAMGINYIDLLAIRELVERKVQACSIQDEATEQPKAS